MKYVQLFQIASWASKLAYGLSAFYSGGNNQYNSIWPQVFNIRNEKVFFISFYLDGKVVISTSPASNYLLCVQCTRESDYFIINYYEVQQS